MRLLLTGFEPFGVHRINPSQLVAERLGGVILPVSVARMPRELERAINATAPDVVVGLGLAALRTQVAIERVAINVLDFTLPDNDGVLLEGEPIDSSGPAAWFSTLPIKRVAARWLEEEIPSYLSNTAGTYICNQMLYTALRLGQAREFSASFIHLPPLEKVSLEKQLRAVELALDVIEADLAVTPGR
jgi:pyroglutamyl-peptidase